MLTGVSVSCFLLSYVVVLVVEASRFLFKLPGRSVVLIAMLSAGLAAHSIFVFNEMIVGVPSSAPELLSSWFQWAVIAAWGLAVACLILTIRNPDRAMGLFLIPVVLGLIGLAQLVREAPPFHPSTTVNLWRAIHGVSLLVGTMIICFGFAFGLMYLVQSHRLKSKVRSRGGLRLPTLEFLQSMNRSSLFISTVSLGLGLLSGIVLNLGRDGQIAWYSGGILFTVVLFAWSLIASLMELSSSSALGGRQSAYLAIANFFFLVVVLGLVLFSSHGIPPIPSTTVGFSQELLGQVTQGPI
ncbi:hypothetical protein Q31a_65310 [Aureliella helgolandensis]|uniref:Cytochrome C assembly protein n=1 Tax=Aureliella helgolandensis TaxID=2527968 RepID=A0A518GHR4_9BACT|nr:hypothetical protein Q31a_65310 [Aureliella helgolandensis]